MRGASSDVVVDPASVDCDGSVWPAKRPAPHMPPGRRQGRQRPRTPPSSTLLFQVVWQGLLDSQKLGYFFLHLDDLLRIPKLMLKSSHLLAESHHLGVRLRFRLGPALLRLQRLRLPLIPLSFPIADVRGIQPLSAQQRPPLPLQGRVVLAKHRSLVLRWK